MSSIIFEKIQIFCVNFNTYTLTRHTRVFFYYFKKVALNIATFSSFEADYE